LNHAAILSRILPGEKYADGRREYTVRNPTRADGKPGSFKIRVSGRRAGCWADFATGDKGGDVVSLVAYVERVSQFEAALLLCQMFNIRDEADLCAVKAVTGRSRTMKSARLKNRKMRTTAGHCADGSRRLRQLLVVGSPRQAGRRDMALSWC
jgi:hypothetical protein